MSYKTKVESWNVRSQPRDNEGKFLYGDGPAKRVGKIVVRDSNGRFHGATNFRQESKVGQVAVSRR